MKAGRRWRIQPITSRQSFASLLVGRATIKVRWKGDRYGMRNPLVIRSWTSYFNDILGIPCRFLCCWADFASQAICEALLTTIPLLSHDSPKYIHSHPTIPRSLIHRLNPPQIYLKPTYQDVADLASPTPALQPETTKAVSLSQNSDTPSLSSSDSQ